MRDIHFVETHVASVQFDHSHLSHTTFTDATLKQVQFNQAMFNITDFSKAYLSDINFNNSNINLTQLQPALCLHRIVLPNGTYLPPPNLLFSAQPQCLVKLYRLCHHVTTHQHVHFC